MEHYDHLYDVSENANVRFLGFISEGTRHDFGIVFTHKFYGKPLVICMQTGQSTLLSSDDAVNQGTCKGFSDWTRKVKPRHSLNFSKNTCLPSHLKKISISGRAEVYLLLVFYWFPKLPDSRQHGAPCLRSGLRQHKIGIGKRRDVDERT